jgi:hypothetical protein
MMSTVSPAAAVTAAVHERRHKQRTEALAVYRKFIEQSHAGKKLTEAETAKVVDAMNFLEIPSEAVDKDIAAWDRHLSYQKSLDEIPAKRAALEPELERLTSRIKSLQDELRQAERDHRVKCHEGTSMVALEGQASSFRGANPRLFAEDVDRACTLPRQMPEYSPRPPESAVPVPYFSALR